MTDRVSHWAVSNAGPERLLVWLEPWAEEFEVPPRSNLTLRFDPGANEPAEIESTGDRIVVWADAGQTARVYIDDELQQSGSASLPVPTGLDCSTKEFLSLIFAGQPPARLGGEGFEPQALSWWQRDKRRLRL